jgi:hypothetical protein
MVHGHLLRGKGAAAPVANTQRKAVLPPAAAPQFAGLVPLALDLLLSGLDDEMFQCEPPNPYKSILITKKQGHGTRIKSDLSGFTQIL